MTKRLLEMLTHLKSNIIKIASLNCAGLKSHFIDILVDETLLKADIIHLVETSLESNEANQWTIPGYSSQFINIGKGKGIATFFKQRLFTHKQDFIGTNMQVTKFSSSDVDSINVYRSSNGNSVELLHNIIANDYTWKVNIDNWRL